MRTISLVVIFVIGILLLSLPAQYVLGAVTSVVINSPTTGQTVGASFSLSYTVADNGTNTATAGSITFTESGTSIDPNDPHTFTMSVPADTSVGVHVITSAALEAGFGNSLVNAATYDILVSVTDGGVFSDTVTSVTMNFGGGGGNGCDGECSEPTMGVNSYGKRLVENGFTYNGKQIDVERFFTPYPLITVNVGIQNTAVFKIYDNLGPDNIRHFDLAFGLSSGQIMGTSNAMIQWDRSFDGIETVTVVDPHNVLDNVRVDTLEGKCRTDSSTDDCLIIIVNHTFRAPLESDIVATNVWDQRRNAWQNYYNHGVNVEGESLNPPNEYVGIYKGNLVHLIETGKNIAVDGQDNIWTFDKVWKKDYIPNGKIDDGITSHVYDRNHMTFSIYKYGQELLAQKILDEFCPKCGIESFNEINDIEFYQFPDTIYKRDANVMIL